jgi:NAD(P)-dependent dehydrogenase (short-subunit alcohol dehydrogenase family)
MVETVVANEGHIDVLVNNFGTSNPRKDLDIEHTAYEDYIATVNVNLASVFLTAQAVIPYMAKNGGGSIINISSIGGIVPDISQIAYGTSKAAINYLTKLIAVQEARNNIRCNAVLPGMTATDAVTNNLTDSFRDFFLKHTPIKRMGLPEEIAGTVAYFASDDAAYTTGQIVDVSGGFGMPTPIFGDMIEMKQKR